MRYPGIPDFLDRGRTMTATVHPCFHVYAIDADHEFDLLRQLSRDVRNEEAKRRLRGNKEVLP